MADVYGTGHEVHDRRGLRRARYAVAAVFAVHGAVTGSFATRVPWIQDHASVSAGQLGLALAFPAFGAAVAMPLASRITHRFGSRAALRGLLALWTLSLILPSLSPNVYALCPALFAYGAAAGMSDVAMNALGVEVENRLDKSIMSGLHGMWSAGALVGSAGGTLAAHLGSDARVHHALAAGVLTVLGLAACHWVLDLRPTEEEEPPPRFSLPPRSALLIGAVGFCAVFAEGASLDWSAVYLRDRLETSAGLAAACTTGFTLTMAVARLVGDAVVDRFGAARTVRVGGVLATLGGLMVVLAGHPAVAMSGFALMGLGIAVVVPLCFAAAGRSGPNPSQAIAGVAAITYTSGLVAPGAIGTLAEATSLMASFALVTVLASGLALFAGVLRVGDRDRQRVSGGPGAAVPDPRP
ncbi:MULTISPECIES: MFS transporter [Streptomyces]|jgi:MFS family permease|uniref:Transport protein n=3 Tax=Streptomyces griseoaurantiacus TaxID=68213 RepID=F3NKW0_9ACTN|nr:MULTISPECIES: MFS transporter [Streptomyces]EGG45686.1 transport protein [Streptomyces griseoaurantiacus M045]MBA5225081.1 MFS transporter [Streptomyces griseoaurantiacus]MCF0085739.1 Inner membrane protein YbjJ [Streptomyces sp. MH192]MCF0102766.1 Inner membrane protein YbjJ [Streptomyces sp. MH191]MDX3090097.1 MFS transporter [Streptomyces sp. ME12-02E]